MRILVTGGAGFIGSNLVEALLSDERVSLVRVLDNLSTGFLNNIKGFFDNAKFDFIKGDIRDYETCMGASKDMDIISHQAALGSVPRSIKDPLMTNHVNISGTLNVFQADVESNIKRVVFAASSSTYGDSKELPKKEDVIGRPLSPYAVTKLVNEIYAEAYAMTYDFQYIGLRYFNVFGPRQDPNGAYAAVIPLFFDAALKNKQPIINGDGTNSRDFTYVDNAVKANILSIFLDSESNKKAVNTIYNVACGSSTNLTELWTNIKNITNTEVNPIYGPNRKGDIPHSLADISKAESFLKYGKLVEIESGLKMSYDYYLNSLK